MNFVFGPRRLRSQWRLAVVAGGLALCIAYSAAWAQAAGNLCGELPNHYGPYDYRYVRDGRLSIVEKVHFTPGIESLSRPGTTTFGMMASDVAYTLHTFPNHHRALITMVRLEDRHRNEQPAGATYTVACYFDRAVRFAPDDSVVRSLYAHYLAKYRKNRAGALVQLAAAQRHANDNPLTYFNVGLLYLEIGEHEQALSAAHRAMALGLTRTELRDKLVVVGKWSEAAALPSSAAASESASAPADKSASQ